MESIKNILKKKKEYTEVVISVFWELKNLGETRKLDRLRSPVSSLAFEHPLSSGRSLVQEELDILRSHICLESAIGPSGTH